MRKGTAVMLAGGAVVSALLAGRRYSPTPDHPGTALWYARLEKPSYTPPGPVFGVAWTILDGLMWFAGYRLLTRRRSPARQRAIAAWLANVLGIGGYSWVFFGQKRPDAALGVTGAMLGSSMALVGTASQVDKQAAWASTPLVGWIAFANLLQEEVWRRNQA